MQEQWCEEERRQLCQQLISPVPFSYKSPPRNTKWPLTTTFTTAKTKATVSPNLSLKKITKEQTFSLKSYIFKKKMTPIKPILFSLLFFNESTLSSPPFTIFLLLGIILVITILHVLSETQLHVLFEPIFVPFLFTDQP
ncbi:hypothetical protein NC651_011070 [Populus alba x Populus x berolinensis]|nr:hypothetical protein NC651_011070 [Populus alba x Populus x berolinensis]